MKVVWTNGCFDILHRGHVEMLEYAKSLGDYLVVGVDTDKRVRGSKGDGRPVNTMEDRVRLLESIKYIDKVCWFDSDEELDTQVLSSGAEVIVVGSDYKNKNVIGSRHVEEIKFYEKIDGYSTTKTINNLNGEA